MCLGRVWQAGGGGSLGGEELEVNSGEGGDSGISPSHSGV